MKKLLLLTAAILLAGAGCGSKTDVNVDANVNTNTQPSAATQPANQPDAVIIDAEGTVGGDAQVQVNLTAKVGITAGGTFSPATITVKQGTTVTWTNTGTAKVWIASDPHPTHTDYPGFNSGTDIGAGESWSFTFDKKGTWGYHNHLNPTAKGTVVVE